MSEWRAVAIDSVEDMKILFDQIPLDQNLRLYDHERGSYSYHGQLYRRGRRARSWLRKAVGYHSERHIKRVYGSQHIHISA